MVNGAGALELDPEFPLPELGEDPLVEVPVPNDRLRPQVTEISRATANTIATIWRLLKRRESGGR